MTAGLHFDEASHAYTLDGLRLPSVTQILAPIKPDFAMVPRSVLESKRALGVAVHLACEIVDDGDDVDVAPEVEPYLAAWLRFRDTQVSEIVMNEQRLASKTLRFAGTLDRLVRDREGALWLIDLKTAAEAHASWGVQLAGYLILLRESMPAEAVRRAALMLHNDASYSLIRYENPNDEPAFRACLSIAHWKESNL